MPLTLQEVQHIADLARLTLTRSELLTYREQLSAILDYADALKDLDTNGVPPTSSVLDMNASLRDDNPQPGFSTTQVLQNAPQTQSGQFRVPPVME